MLSRHYLAIVCLLACATAAANTLPFSGTELVTIHRHTITIPNNKLHQISKLSVQPATKQVAILRVKLNHKQKTALQGRLLKLHKPGKHRRATHANFPSRVDLGMNNVPVLDQGLHGSCATFANTAAVDALIGKGDYISQLCNLELGSYLEDKSDYPSGWNGSFGPFVLRQMQHFGVVKKSFRTVFNDNGKHLVEDSSACGGAASYPLLQANSNGTPVSLADFNMAHTSLLTTLHWHNLIDMDEITDDNIDMDKVLNQVKAELNSGHRVTFGVILPVRFCSTGACGTSKAKYDSWVFTPAMQTARQFGGHEMIIIGYDDKQTATDDEGNQYQGMLHLRNSWGADAGDNGDYYMSYKYFKTFVMEAQSISKETANMT